MYKYKSISFIIFKPGMSEAHNENVKCLSDRLTVENQKQYKTERKLK